MQKRCEKCNKLLGRGYVIEFAIKCPRCKFENVFKSAACAKPIKKDGAHAHNESNTKARSD